MTKWDSDLVTNDKTNSIQLQKIILHVLSSNKSLSNQFFSPSQVWFQLSGKVCYLGG